MTVLGGCAAAPPPDEEDAAVDTASVTTTTLPQVIYLNTQRPDHDEDFLLVFAQGTEAAARATLPSLQAEWDATQRSRCAERLHKSPSSVFLRVFGKSQSVFASNVVPNEPPPANATKWTVTVGASHAYCSTEDLSAWEVVVVGPDAHLRTLSGKPLAAPSKVLVEVDQFALAGMGQDLSRLVLPTEIHMQLRTNGGAFRSIDGLSALHPVHDRQAEFLHGGFVAPVALGAGADRLEVFFRLSRWSIHNPFGEDGSVQGGQWDKPASDLFISDFGRNFSLPVTK